MVNGRSSVNAIWQAGGSIPIENRMLLVERTGMA
jgi:hypothetical protein